MNSRLGIAFLSAFALISFVVAGCSKNYNSSVTPPQPSPSPSGSPAPDTIYVQTSGSKQIRAYKGASQDNGLVVSSAVYPTADISNGDAVYDPVSDSLWYPEAQTQQSTNNPVLFWIKATTKNNMNPDVTVPFSFGEGAASFDGIHHLLFVATTQGPQVSVYQNPEMMTSSATPAAVVTLAITDGVSGATPRPQEMLYDPTSDRLYASDQVSVVAVFDGFGAAANAAAIAHTNPTISANRYLQGLFSPDGLAYSASSDVLFVGEQQNSSGDIVVVHHASTFNGPVGHSQMITGFARPGGLAFDDTTTHGNLLFVYDTSPVYIIPNAITAAGAIQSLQPPARVIIDATAQGNSGFGLALDTTH